MSDRHSKFIEHLAGLDAGALAVLRRSLAKEPGKDPRAFPFVEPFVANASSWTRRAYYLLAGLFAFGALRTGDTLTTTGEPLGKAVYRLYKKQDESPSVEKRFIALLDADEEELPHRMRQMVSLVKASEIPLDWARLLQEIEHWNTDSRWVQVRMARDFYGQEHTEKEVES